MKRQIMASLVLVLALSASVGCSRINPGHVGIKVTNGGSDRGVSDFPTQVGWVLYNPLTTTIFEYPTFVQPALWTKNPNEGSSPNNDEITFSNKDNMLIAADVNLGYHLDAAKVPAFYVKFRNDDLTGFTHGFLKNAVRDAFNTHAGKYEISQIMGDNAAFLAEVKLSLQDQVGPLGVVIDQFGIIGIPRPPQVVIDAINNKVHATQLAQQKQNELIQVQADAAKVVAKANGDALATTVWSEAQAAANRKIGESLTPTLVQYKALEKWNGILPTMTGSNAIPFINVTKQ
jgi:regulator of protease activity HflC (stomatin/prohibitin superfamily)